MADADAPSADPPGALPRGARLAEFELRRVLGIGGFGIVYLAFDHALEREVAVKEYMPSSLVGRDGSMAVSLLSQAHAESFTLGLRSFVNEARLLARFDHPSLVKVHRYWEANNTAYMAMPYYTGSNLHTLRRRMALPPDEAWLRGLLEPLLGALERLHGEAVYHRDISPDNVILQPDGRPVLLDFGAARRVLGDKSMALTAILKPAYAPIEQYAEAGAVKQGPWTDLYALGATLHYLLLGRAPTPATTRTVIDELPPLAGQAAQLPGCTVGFLQCIDWMLQPRPADRPPHVAALRTRLASLPPAPAVAAAPTADGEAWPRTQWLGESAASHAPTVLDPSLTPVTVLAPPAPDTRPTVLMPRDDVGLTHATVVMPRDGQTLTVTGPAEATATATPGASAGTSLDSTALPAPMTAGRGEASLATGPALVADASPGTRPAPRPPAPTRRWPLAVGALGMVGIALWLGLRPAAAPRETASATPAIPASAAFGAASAATPPPAETTAKAPPAAAAVTAGIEAAVATGAEALATPTANAAPAAAQPEMTASAPGARRPARPSTAPAGVATAALARASLPPPVVPPGVTPVVPPVTPLFMPPSPSPAVPSGGPPGLATSITRLPPAEALAAQSATAASATLPARTAPGATQGAEPPRPTTAALAGATPVATAAPAVTSKAPAAAPTRAPDRDAEPVLLQARALGPAERCEGRAPAALGACIDRICKAEAMLREHPDCVKARREAEQRLTPSR